MLAGRLPIVLLLLVGLCVPVPSTGYTVKGYVVAIPGLQLLSLAVNGSSVYAVGVNASTSNGVLVRVDYVNGTPSLRYVTVLNETVDSITVAVHGEYVYVAYTSGNAMKLAVLTGNGSIVAVTSASRTPSTGVFLYAEVIAGYIAVKGYYTVFSVELGQLRIPATWLYTVNGTLAEILEGALLNTTAGILLVEQPAPSIIGPYESRVVYLDKDLSPRNAVWVPTKLPPSTVLKGRHLWLTYGYSSMLYAPSPGQAYIVETPYTVWVDLGYYKLLGDTSGNGLLWVNGYVVALNNTYVLDIGLMGANLVFTGYTVSNNTYYGVVGVVDPVLLVSSPVFSPTSPQPSLFKLVASLVDYDVLGVSGSITPAKATVGLSTITAPATNTTSTTLVLGNTTPIVLEATLESLGGEPSPNTAPVILVALAVTLYLLARTARGAR